MAISSSCVWEVRATGNNQNGGGFVTGSSGTDFSQQDAPQFALTGVTTSGAGAVFLSASAASSMVGNICQVISGTNFTTGLFQIISVVVGVSVTVDRNICTGAGTAGVINIGGAFGTVQFGIDAISVADQITYVKAGTYTVATTLTTPNVSSSNYQTSIIGYSTTRGDLGRPTLNVSAGINGINLNQIGWKFENFEVVGTTSAIGINATGAYCAVSGCVVSGCATGIFLSSSSGVLFNCGVTTATTAGFSIGGATRIISCTAYSNTCPGFTTASADVTFLHCASINNTGASSDGFFNSSFGAVFDSCFAYGNGRDGIRLTLSYAMSIGGVLVNCLLADNGGYGLNWTSVPTARKNTPAMGSNGFWSNALGAFNNYVSQSTDVTISGTDPTNDPFVSKATGDFALNDVVGAGALLRAASISATIGIPNTTNYRDIGLFQHQDSGGSSGIIRNPEL